MTEDALTLLVALSKQRNMKTIYQLRRRLIMSQAELADLLGKSVRTIQRWEADEVMLSEETILELWANKEREDLIRVS